jgi:hypothetical protein
MGNIKRNGSLIFEKCAMKGMKSLTAESWPGFLHMEMGVVEIGG